MQPSDDPYVPHLGDDVTLTHTDGTTTSGHLWTVRPGYVRIITPDGDMVHVDRDHIADMEPVRYGVGDRIRIDAYDGVHDVTIRTILPGAVGVATDDGRTATLHLPPAPGVTITHLRRATQDEVDALMANAR
ncbi:hypothetical protein [Streptomonospora wellingtoniae]|uniref:DUF3006 domain-containing protein n=1 Tax=Streptomonospora wellingtoniae TaxID=3075544 RepID=A0ABU2KUG8_9ACTN|nr:hypothetical protein [Streptomonospora sp. DSM 45055]MDT0302941.1 hypothetical protein [Streptomonospora sp. DSM 45055]